MRWTGGGDLANLSSLIEVSAANFITLVPEAADARYEFATGTMRTGEGQPITDATVAEWADNSWRGGAQSVGTATIKRGVLLNSLARRESGQEPQLLERVIRQRRQLVKGGLARVFYQTPPQIVRDAAAWSEEINRILPALRAELDGLDVNCVICADANELRFYG